MKLLIADDHTLFRDALVQYIERADPSSSVTLAKDFPQAMDILEQNPYQDLVILDLRMPGMNGMEGFEKIKEQFPEQAVALMSGVAEEQDVRNALDLGAVGYFPKTMSGKGLLNAIRQVASGEVFIPEGAGAGNIMPSYYDDLSIKTKPVEHVNGLEKARLTPRETEVLSYLADGASNKDIARALNLQIVTVKLHVRGICRKLEAKNRTQAALIAKEMGVSPTRVASQSTSTH